MGRLIIITTKGETIVKDNVEKVGLAELKEGVGGGYIETIPYFDRYEGKPCVAFCDEEGKLDGLDLNHKATALWYDLIGQPVGDYLVGDIIIVQGKELLKNL